MSESQPDVDPQLSPTQLALLGGFEAEAAEVFPELGAPDPGDAALVERLADAAVEAVPGPASSGSAGGGGTVGTKIVGALGAAAVTGLVVAAIMMGRGSETDPAAEPSAVERVTPPELPEAEPEAAVAIGPVGEEPESEPIAAREPELEAEATDARPKAHPRPEKRGQLEPSPESEPTLSARDLLKAANAARRIGDYAKAEAGYERLAREFAGSREAMIGRVSLGKLQLERLGAPADALQNFDAYLAANPRGNLAEEALYGRARALRRLGQRAEERAAWGELLENFPNTVHADEARRQLGSGD